MPCWRRLNETSWSTATWPLWSRADGHPRRGRALDLAGGGRVSQGRGRPPAGCAVLGRCRARHAQGRTARPALERRRHGKPDAPREQDAERETAGSAWQDNGLVFASKSGSLLDPKHVNRILDSLAEMAGARRIRFHDLRHTCAPLLLGQGVAPRTVMEVLGHSQMSITTDLYGHVMLTTLRDAADAMDAALSAPASGNEATR
ncbi:tyrosine-type recombinase/integrase [Promicromonospora sp. CA-289599]|uniref:tyrosine-type recombinase/integrase n=1 Tax=Promicromonospora sp. CA-289599 TaxID=3240014 RepID=UPI003D948317